MNTSASDRLIQPNVRPGVRTCALLHILTTRRAGIHNACRASTMNSLKARFEAFQRSRVGLFLKKALDDKMPNLAALLAWGTLSAMLPLLLGVLSLAGL